MKRNIKKKHFRSQDKKLVKMGNKTIQQEIDTK